MTQQEIAEKLGINQATVSLWMRDKAYPSPIAMKLLKDLLPEYYERFNKNTRRRK
jgi:transcriptional regulator with XRE-family HTH domain